jgi:transcriptional regulator with XRE-family HTH domain
LLSTIPNWLTMKNDNVDTILRLAWLEGLVKTHGAYEKAVARRVVQIAVSPQERSRVIERLEAALAGRKQPLPLTVGGLLKSLRASGRLTAEDIFSRIGVTKNIYALMEQDAISPLRIPAGVWRKLIVLLNISFEEIAEILRATCRLIVYRPSFGGMLARYKGKKGGKKKLAMEKAFTELYTRAELPLPPEDEKRLNALLSEIQALG